jgi:Peptidase S24-like
MRVTEQHLRGAILSFMNDNDLRVAPWCNEAKVSEGTLRAFLKGDSHTMKVETLEKLSRVRGVSVNRLLGLSDHHPPQKVMVVAYVGAGGEVYTIDDHEKGGGIDEVDCPPGMGPQEVVALRIRGDSMYPVFRNGWIVYYNNRRDIFVPLDYEPSPSTAATSIDPLRDLFDEPCVVKLKDGRTLLKILKHGQALGLYTLASYNAPDLENIEIEWAAKVIFIKTA